MNFQRTRSFIDKLRDHVVKSAVSTKHEFTFKYLHKLTFDFSHKFTFKSSHESFFMLSRFTYNASTSTVKIVNYFLFEGEIKENVRHGPQAGSEIARRGEGGGS